MISAIVLLPLISAVVCGFFNKKLSHKAAAIISSSLILISTIISIKILISYISQDNPSQIEHIIYAKWFDIFERDINWAIYIDNLTIIMSSVITIVSFLVHIYSIEYMSQDENMPRFMAYLSLFTFFMLTLVLSDNFVQLFFGWEGVGFCSYLLIGFWYKKDSACAASQKAFIVNRISDFAFIIAIIMIGYYCDSFVFSDVIANTNHLSELYIDNIGFRVLDIICLLLFIGCMGKSAQIGFHVWLADAMEGPTPASALIHAATMVTAGVFLIVKNSFLFESSTILNIITTVGAITCFIAGTMALMQRDIKKIIAYSTCSQLGYMFMACGVSAYSAAMFHLITHACFKALLFLCAGSVIHATHEQDITKMGDLRRQMPYTYTMFCIGSLAIMGIVPFAGYYSKDLILESIFIAGTSYSYWNFAIGIAGVVLTACYSTKIIYSVFHGPRNRITSDTEIHESGLLTIVPLAILACGSVVTGIYGHYVMNIGHIGDYFGNTTAQHEINLDAINIYVKYAPLFATFFGILITIYIIKNSYSDRKISIIEKIIYNKYYFDEIYNAYIVKAMTLLSFLCASFEKDVIDKYGPSAISNITKSISGYIRKMHSGYIPHYIFIILLGLVLVISWCLAIFLYK